MNRSALGARHSALGTRHSALGARRSALGARRSALGPKRNPKSFLHLSLVHFVLSTMLFWKLHFFVELKWKNVIFATCDNHVLNCWNQVDWRESSLPVVYLMDHTLVECRNWERQSCAMPWDFFKDPFLQIMMSNVIWRRRCRFIQILFSFRLFASSLKEMNLKVCH